VTNESAPIAITRVSFSFRQRGETKSVESCRVHRVVFGLCLN
jgi:hypothetical protein